MKFEAYKKTGFTQSQDDKLTMLVNSGAFDRKIERIEIFTQWFGEQCTIRICSRDDQNNHNQLTLYERPIHYTDVKRETLYIKESNEWGKEQSNEKISSAIEEVIRNIHWLLWLLITYYNI